MHIIVNGQSQEMPEGSTVGRLLLEMGLSGQRVAVERNLEVVPRGLHGDTSLCDGDRLEIIRAVGGG